MTRPESLSVRLHRYLCLRSRRGFSIPPCTSLTWPGVAVVNRSWTGAHPTDSAEVGTLACHPSLSNCRLGYPRFRFLQSLALCATCGSGIARSVCLPELIVCCRAEVGTCDHTRARDRDLRFGYPLSGCSGEWPSYAAPVRFFSRSGYPHNLFRYCCFSIPLARALTWPGEAVLNRSRTGAHLVLGSFPEVVDDISGDAPPPPHRSRTGAGE